MLADISSGFNVSKNFSLDARFIDLCGFTEADITAVHLGLQDLTLTGASLRKQPRDALAALPMMASDLDTAEAQLAHHRLGLEQAYGERLRLHTHAVVALGFERLVWRSSPGPRA